MCPVLGLSHPGVSQSRSLPWSSRSHPQARHRRIWGCMQLWPDLCHKQRMRTTIAWDTGFGCQSPVSVPASANTSLLLLLKVTFSSSHSTTRTIWYQQGIQRHPSSIKTLHSSLHLIPSHPIPFRPSLIAVPFASRFPRTKQTRKNGTSITNPHRAGSHQIPAERSSTDQRCRTKALYHHWTTGDFSHLG